MSNLLHPLLHLIERALQDCAQCPMSSELATLLMNDPMLLAALQRLSLHWLSTSSQSQRLNTHIVEGEAWIVK